MSSGCSTSSTYLIASRSHSDGVSDLKKKSKFSATVSGPVGMMFMTAMFGSPGKAAKVALGKSHQAEKLVGRPSTSLKWKAELSAWPGGEMWLE